jgi:hypothetical protein
MSERLGPTIGNWTQQQLVKFVQNLIRLHPPESSTSLSVEEVDVVKKLKCFDQIQFLQGQTTVGTAGGAAALPATPAGYIPILDFTGNTKLIPYYNAP